MDKVPQRELTYSPIDDEGRPLTLPALRESNAGHDIDTCDKPICEETRRIIAARGAAQRNLR